MTEKSPFNHQKTSYCWCLAIRSERILHLKENIFHRMISLKTQNSRSFSPKIPILAFNLKFTCGVCEILLGTLSYQIQITNCHFPVCQTLCLGMNQLKQEEFKLGGSGDGGNGEGGNTILTIARLPICNQFFIGRLYLYHMHICFIPYLNNDMIVLEKEKTRR